MQNVLKFGSWVLDSFFLVLSSSLQALAQALPQNPKISTNHQQVKIGFSTFNSR